MPEQPGDPVPPRLEGMGPAFLGWCSIVLGSLGTLLSIAGVMGWIFSTQGRAGSNIPWTVGLAFSLLAALLLAIGIGQVRKRRRARRWAIGWALAALVYVAAETLRLQGIRATGGFVFHEQMLTGMLAYYPILTLAFMLTPQARREMTR